MNSEVQTSTRIIKVIGKHVDELDGCKHSIIEIMKEAFDEKEDDIGTWPQEQSHVTSSHHLRIPTPEDTRVENYD